MDLLFSQGRNAVRYFNKEGDKRGLKTFNRFFFFILLKPHADGSSASGSTGSFKKITSDYEILLVNDGSPDDSVFFGDGNRAE